MKLLFISAAVLSALCTPAWAVNKCTGSDGKVTFQDALCAGKGERIEVRPNTGLELPKPLPAAAEALAPSALPIPAQQLQAPSKAPLEQEADMCMAWYKPLLRDPAGAYYTVVSKERRVLSITVHATNGYGGYTTKVAACEIYNGQLNPAWTKTHAQRGGWAVE